MKINMHETMAGKTETNNKSMVIQVDKIDTNSDKNAIKQEKFN